MAGSTTRNIPAVLAVLSLCVALGATNPKGQARSSSPCASGAAYYSDSSDCNAYYQCVSGAGVQLRCQPGLHWNNVAVTCDWPETAGCVLEAHGGDDEDKDEVGAGDVEDEKEEEVEEEEEEEEEDSGDSGDSSVSSGESGTSEESVEGSESSSESSSESDSESDECEDDDSHPECPKEGSELTQFIPHSNPTQFYHCSNGIAPNTTKGRG
ncbi:chromatin modification-related protein EAF7-like [Zootermopsis nevadensis]|uniref:chromatin modification-related protein EAF7-like n=1 Tax=Zootermopsis nevadensis TaxID=136037 RepID=UPI000B8EACD0|nr:chromatin modification-related protein EAF7-like [Zootermopsis nevadensis]